MKLRQFTVVLALGILTLFLASDLMANPIEIQFWHAQRGPREETLNKIVDAYNKSQTKFKVVASHKGSYDETMNAGIAAFRSNKQPHLLQVYEVGTQTMMLSNAIYPVFNLMKDTGHKIDWKSYLQPVLSYYVSSKGELQSMPFNSSTPIMYYNKDLFKKAGLTGPPRTWDEMGEYTKKLVASGTEYGMTVAWQTWVMIENYSAIHDIPLATKANGFDGLDTELTINNPMVIKHMERLKTWLDDKRFTYEEREYKGPEAAFISGKCAILMDSISAIGALKKNIKFDWDAAPLPVEASMKNPQNSIIGGASLWVLKGHPKAEYQGVADFLAFHGKRGHADSLAQGNRLFSHHPAGLQQTEGRRLLQGGTPSGSGNSSDDPQGPDGEFTGNPAGKFSPDPRCHERRAGNALAGQKNRQTGTG